MAYNYSNAAFKGIQANQGNVSKYFEETIGQMIQLNDGSHSFSTVTVDCHDNPAPFHELNETMIAITHQGFPITQIEDGFLTFTIRARFELQGLDGATDYNDPHEVNQIFVGFKNSAEILDQLQINCRGRSIGIQDNECLREGFAYQTLRPVEAKKKRYDHSLYEHVWSHRKQVCGVYIPIHKFKAGPVTVEFEINLPITDILCLQAFTLYPNFCLGELELKFYVKQFGLVWCQSSVKEIAEALEIMDEPFPSNTNELHKLTAKIKHAFSQIGQSSLIVTKYQAVGAQPWSGILDMYNDDAVQDATAEYGSTYPTASEDDEVTPKATVVNYIKELYAEFVNGKQANKADTTANLYTGITASSITATSIAEISGQVCYVFKTYVTGEFQPLEDVMTSNTVGLATLTCKDFTIQRCNSSIFGFGLVQSSINSIRNFFSTPRYIPSQELAFYAFPHAPTEGGVSTSVNIPVHNCNCVTFMFPRRPTDRTVFENIMYQNLQCTIGNRNYPEQPFTTHGARFLQYQLIASDLDGPIEPTEEYQNSISRNKNADDGSRYDKTQSDQTSFMFNVQLERSNAGYCFDGIDSNGQNIAIQLKGSPIYSGTQDTYYCVESTSPDIIPTNTSQYQHPPPPQIWICQETCFLASVDRGLVYLKTDNPPDRQVLN
jgi:hypothetical protein